MESLSKIILLFVTCAVAMRVRTVGKPSANVDELGGQHHLHTDRGAQPVDVTESKETNGESRIVNGREAKEGEFPFMVALHVHNRFRCSSCLIAPTIVLTAAHCVRFRENGTQPVDSFFAILGNIQRDGPETRIEFSEVIPHPEYADIGGSEADIAILRTREPVQLSDLIQTICLPEADRTFEMQNVRAIGWGRTSTNAEETSPVLRTTELRVMSHQFCRLFYGLYNVTITDRHVCVNSHRETGVCSGDSGSPLVYKENGRPITIGVASFINPFGCGRPYLPSTYTANSKFKDWLVSMAGDGVELCFV